ncbi:MAG: DUF1501 domain-containing protein [Candidatus Eremiobacteraeota bacterium]|nr:DUF1501 domain-containing protein [Candidatus Eremiobacteraeota bacterium]
MRSRRAFLSQTLSVAVLGGTLPSFLADAALAQPLPALGSSIDPANVLLVIQMGGGNDGLNTVIPYSDDSHHRARPTIAVAAPTVLKIDDRIGLNPAMSALDDLYKEGNVAIVQGVGYPNPNRSHFEATQIWETASPEGPVTSGWLGRYLDRTVAKRAATADAELFTAVSLGDTIPTALIAQHVDVPAIGALGNFGYNAGKDAASKQTAGTLYDGAKPGQSPYLDLLQQTARNAMHGGDVLEAKLASYRPAVAYPSDAFAQQLRLAAQIVSSQVGTRIIFVSIGSFDTHAGQRAQQDRLLGYLANGLRAFYTDLAAHHLSDRVLAMTFSEFGRRVTQNASNGTDHGTAMPLFIVGGKSNGGVYGEHPSLTDLDNGDLKHGIDFRSVYATVLERWLGRDPSGIIAGTYDPVAFV